MHTERDQNKDLLTKRRYASVSCNNDECDWSSDGYVLLSDFELNYDIVLTNEIAQKIIKHHQRTHSFFVDYGHEDYTLFLLNEHITKPVVANSAQVIYLGSKV